MRDEKTFYEGDLSYSDRQRKFIKGIPRTPPNDASAQAEQDTEDWKNIIRTEIGEAIESGNLREIKEGEQCNLFVTFNVSKSHQDVDNLLQVPLDSLNLGSLNLGDVSRGIRVEREMVEEGEEGMHIEYVITKTFEIESVRLLEGDELKEYRSYWNFPMQHITAYEISNGKKASCEPHMFIDNIPGRLFLAQPENKYAKLIPPGYNWGHKTGRTVDGCMVFKKEVLKEVLEKHGNPETNKEPFYWLTKW